MSWLKDMKEQDPLAWVVFCEKGEENDYTVFWYEEDAQEHAELTEESFELEEGSKEVIPLYPDLPAAIELVEEMARLLDLAGYVYKADTQWDRDRRAVLAKINPKPKGT